MRSPIRLSDSVLGLLVSACVVLAGCWVVVTIDRHAKEHGHCFSYAMTSVERAERSEDQSGREGQDVVHDCSVPQSGPVNHVRSATP